jgi:hypothetical protein
VKKILDKLATLSDQTFQNLMGFNWARMHYTINLAVELTLGITSSTWNIESVRNVIRLETYLDLLYQRLDAISFLIESSEGNGNWYQFLSAKWASLKRTYLNGLLNRGIQVPDLGVQVFQGGNEMATSSIPNLLRSQNATSADLSSIDFMLNDWMLLPQDQSIIPQQQF